MLQNQKVPIPTQERLATYLRVLIELKEAGVQTISSADIEHHTGISAVQFRKDLSYFGDFGKPGVGYRVKDLLEEIERRLKIDREQPMILVGAGNLGAALVGYPGFRQHHFKIVAVFDNNYAKIGRYLWDLEIQDIARLKEINQDLKAKIAILAVPAAAAQEVAEQLIAAGIVAIMNFAPVHLRVAPHVHVRNISFLQELAVLSYHLYEDEQAAQEALDNRVEEWESGRVEEGGNGRMEDKETRRPGDKETTHHSPPTKMGKGAVTGGV